VSPKALLNCTETVKAAAETDFVVAMQTKLRLKDPTSKSEDKEDKFVAKEMKHGG